MKTLQLTDHQIAELIEKHSLKLRSSEGCVIATNYYNNDDLSFELLIVINNRTCEKVVYLAESESIYNLDPDKL